MEKSLWFENHYFNPVSLQPITSLELPTIQTSEFTSSIFFLPWINWTPAFCCGKEKDGSPLCLVFFSRGNGQSSHKISRKFPRSRHKLTYSFTHPRFLSHREGSLNSQLKGHPRRAKQQCLRMGSLRQWGQDERVLPHTVLTEQCSWKIKVPAEVAYFVGVSSRWRGSWLLKNLAHDRATP